jgi:acylphosphatase
MAVMTDRRVFVLITGEVQGVGFRWFARDCAQKHRLSGWIRNRKDGNVELVAAGATADVETFLGTLRRGPSHSHVAELQIRDETSEANLPFPFEIRR